jgi:hypothetical protein
MATSLLSSSGRLEAYLKPFGFAVRKQHIEFQRLVLGRIVKNLETRRTGPVTDNGRERVVGHLLGNRRDVHASDDDIVL